MRPSVYYLKSRGWIRTKLGLWRHPDYSPNAVALERAKYLEHRRTMRQIESLLFRPASN